MSPGSGEGRSYITANLAVLFSQMGKRTLVIDADLRKPRQHRIFGLPGKIGLSALLAGRAGAEVMCDIPQLPGLTVLPAGVLPPNPQELLSRPRLPAAGAVAARHVRGDPGRHAAGRRRGPTPARWRRAPAPR